jgi:hypothetical protein
MLVGRERFRNDYVVIWKPDQIFKKSDREGDVSREASPSRFCGQDRVPTASQGAPHMSQRWGDVGDADPDLGRQEFARYQRLKGLLTLKVPAPPNHDFPVVPI